jgi:hypothetical protein
LISQKKFNQINILLVVWGKKYIDDFFKFSLPSLLAPDNLPALTSSYHTQFTFLARQQDVAVFEAHPAYQTLQSLCQVNFIYIDDLIVFGHYATTITLAYERGIKQAGEAMLNTYFMLLTSDLIMANGSMQGVMRYLQTGHSTLYVGSIQVIKEELEPYLQQKLLSNPNVLSIPPRELLKESLQYLHPIVLANLCTQTVVHNYRAHRFYVRKGQELLVGRYYLLHPLCIKPETTDYQIASSFDYSFVPSMCPSGNVAVINDSDDFLIIEIQSKDHELDQIGSGPYDMKKLAAALAEWTTSYHRDNAKQSLYFHTRDITEKDKIFAEEKLNNLVNHLAIDLKQYKPKPVNHHPYWANTIKAFHQQRAILNATREEDYPDLSVLGHVSRHKKLYYRCFGVPPQVYRWHYRWREYYSVSQALRTNIKDPANTAILYDSHQLDFMCYRSFLEQQLKISHHYYLKNLLTDEKKIKELQTLEFNQIVLLIKLDDLATVDKVLRVIKTILKPNGQCFILICNDKNHYSPLAQHFWGDVAHKMSAMMDSGYRMLNVEAIYSNFTMLGAMTIERINKTFAHSQKLRFLSYITFGLMGSLCCLVKNSLPRFSSKKYGHCTNILVTLTPENELSDTHA